MGLNKCVDFSTAKLLKKKGFDEYADSYYYHDDLRLIKTKNKNSIDNRFKENSCSAPRIAQVIDWLYNKHKIWISVVPYNDEELSQFLWENKIIEKNNNDCSDYTFYHTPTETYKAAIKYTLTYLI